MSFELPGRIAALATLLFAGLTAPLQAQHESDDPAAAAAARAYLPRLERNLHENILPFWMSKGLDEKNGGYFMNLGPDGQPKGPANKCVVGQARTLWFFARLVREGLARPEHRHAADLGFRFLRDHLWDPVHGGFWWEVDESGSQRLRPEKHLYGQGFALYGISEYYLATKNTEALELARRLFDVMERSAHDKAHGGYSEFLNEDWSPIQPGRVPFLSRHLPQEERADFKLMNTHLHIMEGLTVFYEALRLPLVRERLLELITIQSNTVLRKGLGACTDRYAADWTPRLDGDFASVSYGHDLENVWLVMEACRAAELAQAPYLDFFQSVSEYSLKYGYDEKAGGFFASGPFNQPARDLRKIMWVQAESAACALHMYRLTRDARYLEVFQKTWDFIDQHVVDWKVGEWHLVVTPEGVGQGDKADSFKGPYHNGRAVLECMALLRKLAPAGSNVGR